MTPAWPTAGLKPQITAETKADMEQGLNKVMLIGRLEREPELRYTPSGRPVAIFTVATPRVWIGPDGESHQEAEWFSVIAWGAMAETYGRELASGQRVYIEGRLQTRGWPDENGQMHYRSEVVAQEIIALAEPT